MTSQLVVPLDGPKPAYLTTPDEIATFASGDEALELATTAGLILDPWQRDSLRLGLAERGDGKWAASEVGLFVPRQNGKGSVLEALELAHLFLFGTKLIVHSAHEFATAEEHFLRLRELIEGCDDLVRLVKGPMTQRGLAGFRTGNGKQAIILADGRRLLFKTRTGGALRGFSGDLIVLDEAYKLAERVLSAIAPTMAAMPNPQVWLTSSAPLDTEESAALRRFCKRGRKGDTRLAYTEFCAPKESDPKDRRVWAIANPGYPFRIDDDAINTELGLMTPEDFSLERLGIWYDDEDDEDQVIPTADYLACEDEDSFIEGTPVFSLDVSEDRDWSAFAAAGASSVEGATQFELIDYDLGTAWVPARALELVRRWDAKLVIVKGSPAASLTKKLKAEGLQLSSPPADDDDIVLMSSEDYAKACGEMFDAFINRTVRHVGHVQILVAIKGAQKRIYGDDSFIWSRRRSSVDIAPLVAPTIAAGYFGSLDEDPAGSVW